MTLIVAPSLWIVRHKNRAESAHAHTKCVLCCPVRLTGLCVCLQVCFMSGTGLCIMRPLPETNSFQYAGCDVHGGDNEYQLVVLLNPSLCDRTARVQCASSPFRVEHSPAMGRYFSRKRWYPCTKPHGFTLRKTVV
jgi:hypothetical protein